MAGAILFVIGSLWSAMAPNPEMLISARVLLGLAVGIASYTAPLYLSEIAPENPRQYDLALSVDDYHRYSGCVPFRYRVQLHR